jgi:hypothetical protein
VRILPDCINDRPSEIFLFMEHDGMCFVSSLLFDDGSFCRAIGQILLANYGRTIEEIGSLDLGYLL